MRKKIGWMVIMVMLAIAFPVTDSSAEPAGYTCTVNSVGPYSGEIYVSLTSAPSFTGKWFLAPESLRKEVLAIALTAMTNGMTVFVYADLSQGTYPTIVAFYLLQ